MTSLSTRAKQVIGCGAASLVLLLLCGGLIWLKNGIASEGYRDGFVQKLSHKGRFKQTWEGELAMPGFGGSQEGKAGQQSGNIWSFTVEDPEVVKQLESINAAQFVRLHYVEYHYTAPWDGDTSYRVTRVELLKNAAQSP
jgi:hypothetical protein